MLGVLANPKADLSDPRYSLGGQAGDLRQHPYFRSEWLQKLMNLTTVRTHQFAVWITVGFFEVVHRGRPPDLIADQLGQELVQFDGRKIRHRGFFIVDRTRAAGFNPVAPNSAGEVVIYRRLIE
jgi:hypothetical protein